MSAHNWSEVLGVRGFGLRVWVGKVLGFSIGV